jgi:hypothetical protein
MKNRSWPLLLLMPAVALVALAANGCNRSAASAPAQLPPPPVVVTTVEQQELIEWDEFTGRTAPVEYVEVRPRVSGHIQEVRFQPGQLVNQGDVLFQIDPRWHQAELDRREAELAQVQVRLENLKREAARTAQLLATKAISTEEAEARHARYEEARAAAFRHAANGRLDQLRRQAFVRLTFDRERAALRRRAGQFAARGAIRFHPTRAGHDSFQRPAIHEDDVGFLQPRHGQAGGLQPEPDAPPGAAGVQLPDDLAQRRAGVMAAVASAALFDEPFPFDEMRFHVVLLLRGGGFHARSSKETNHPRKRRKPESIGDGGVTPCTTMMKLRAFPTKIFWRASAPLPATQEWGEDRGEGAPNIRVPPLPSPLLHRMEESEWLRLCRAGFIRVHPWLNTSAFEHHS